MVRANQKEVTSRGGSKKTMLDRTGQAHQQNYRKP